MSRIVIVDGNLGNIGSVYNIIRRLGGSAICSGKRKDVQSAEKLILPGVGSFDQGMNALRKLDLITVLNDRVLGDNCPVLGICLGMQLMGNGSEEGSCSGLSWLDFHCERFRLQNSIYNLPVPHIGWNYVDLVQEHAMFHRTIEKPRFYFVHSYHAVAKDREIVYGESTYGYTFPCVLAKNNIVAVQFHPEKSHRFGMQLVSNFIAQ